MNVLIRLIMDILKIIPPLSLISFVSIFFLKILKIEDFLEKIFLLFVFNWVQIIIPIELLSIFRKSNMLNLYVFYTIEVLICIVIALVLKKIPLKISLTSFKNAFRNFYNDLQLNKFLKTFLIIWLIIIILVPLYIGIAIHPPNYDSMTYHLARAGFWYQNNSINHYFTRYVHQNDYPVNSEIGFLWLFIFTNSDLLTFSVQWISFIVALLALYKVLRTLGYNKNISFITTFIFATFDLCILQASSTQNDMLVASFIILVLYFLIKAFNSDNLEMKYLIFSGITTGIVIGAKGYVYLFIPGFLIFILLFGKNNKIKLKKVIFAVLFSLAGIAIFASYSLIQNYISYGNPLGYPGTINEMRMNIFGFKPFASNFLRHLVSFYQKNTGFEFISQHLENNFNILHSKLGVDISDPSTTWPGMYFGIWEHRVNFDTGYFGLLFFLFCLPVSIYNLILFIILKFKKTKLDINKKYLNSLIVTIIPTIFFLGYVLLFKWHIWAGRYMIAFVLLLMIGVAEFFELLKSFKIKYLYYSIILLIVLLSIWSSFYPLFNNEYASISNMIKNKIHPQVANNQEVTENNITRMFKVNTFLNNKFPENSNIGIILDQSDWVYIYFGEKFQRKLTYITNEEWNNNNIKNILNKNNYDALLINNSCRDFYNNSLEPLYSKITDKLLLQIDSSNFKDMFIPINECDFTVKNNEVIINVYGNDPYFKNNFSLDFEKYKSLIIKFELFSEVESEMQIYYSLNNEAYTEDSSVTSKIVSGNNNIYFEIPAENLTGFRVDPIIVDKDVTIKKVEIYSKSNLKYENFGDYYVFYN